ncbi:MAG: lipopolysaccharide biosynthesis protein [Flavobacteriales bacterium]
MGIVAREGIKGTVVSYIGVLIAYVTLVIVLPYCLTEEENGLVRVFVEAVAIFGLIFQLGIPSAIVRYYARHNEQPHTRQAFISLNIWGALLGIVLMCLLGWALKEWIFDYFRSKAPAFNRYYIYMLPAAGFMILAAIFEKFSNTLLKISWPIFFRDVLTRALLAVSVLLYFFDVLSITQMVLSIMIGYGIVFLCQALYFLFISGESSRLRKPALGKGFLKEYSTYLLFTSVGSIGNSIGGRVDIFMITSSLGLKDAAIYSMAMYLATIIELPQRSLGQILSPLMADAITKNDTERIRSINRDAAVSQLMAGFLLFLLIVLNIQDFYAIIPKGEKYAGGIGVVIITGISKLISHAMGANALITTNSKYYRINFVIIILFLAVNITGNYLLIPRYGIEGAAAATAFSTFLIAVIYFLFVRSRYKTQPFSPKSGILLGLFCALLLLGYLIPLHFHPILNMALRSVLLAGIYLFVVLRFNISPPFTDIFYRYAGRFIPRRK